MSEIRKISIGPDYKQSMNYSVGQKIVGGSQTIHRIKMNEETHFIELFVINDKKEICLYKAFSPTMPVSIEFLIDF